MRGLLRSLVLLSLLVGCAAPQQRVILLPAPDGKVGAVEVRSAAGRERLDSAFAGVSASEQGKLGVFKTDEAQVQQQYGELLAARPLRPATFTVYFQSGSSTELAPNSAAVVRQIVEELGRRPAPELVITGHTDAVGSDELNDRLSLQRAQTVITFLSRNGIAASQMSAVGRGRRDLAEQTAKEVAEAANRRVEITIR